MTEVSAAKILHQHHVFAELGEQALRELVDSCESRQLIAGQPIWAPGDPGEAAYILLDGRVELSYRIPPNGHRKVQYSEPGDLFSINSLVGSWPHTSAGTTLVRSAVLELTRERFEALFEEGHPAAFVITDALADELVEEMRDANRRLHEVFGHPAETLRMLRRRSRETHRR